MCVKVNVGLQAKVGQKGETEQVCVVLFFVTCDLHHGLYLLTSTHNILSLHLSPSFTNFLHPRWKEKAKVSHILGIYALLYQSMKHFSITKLTDWQNHQIWSDHHKWLTILKANYFNYFNTNLYIKNIRKKKNIRRQQKHSNSTLPPEKWLDAVDDVREIKGEGHVRIVITPIGAVDRCFLRGQGLCQAGLASVGTEKELKTW